MGGIKVPDRLDQEYLSDLAEKACESDSNAFAELFAAVCQRQYAYLYFLEGDRISAMNSLERVYTAALERIGNLSSPVLFMPWILRLCLQECITQASEHTDSSDSTHKADSVEKEDSIYKADSIQKADNVHETDHFHISGSIPGAGDFLNTPYGTYPVSHLLNMPLTESQILIMRYGQGLSEEDIAWLLNFTPSLLKKCMKSAGKHLQAGEGTAGSEQKDQVLSTPAHLPRPELTPQELSAVLSRVFEKSGHHSNTVPVDLLGSYAVYRKERFHLQKRVLAGLLVIFLLIPLLFITPGFDVVQSSAAGERGLPVYEIKVRSMLPLNSVTAKIRKRSLPVYEAGARQFTVEPTRNGNLTIEVTLFNLQKTQETLEVSDVDSHGPVLVSSETTQDTVTLYVADEGIGVDYREIYAAGASGESYSPLRIDEAEGIVEFAYPQENWDVYIPDHIGNTLHLSFELE